jgi:hypothetical protein
MADEEVVVEDFIVVDDFVVVDDIVVDDTPDGAVEELLEWELVSAV